ncbi:MAG: ROK family transcriptional regulator [Bacteroidales bacterium]|nr:ROK family transcriptional regulator [Bacteroidales bacterium]MCR5246005.1 ROK family transcriptional regulator [Bacteroidales bacterium]
MNPFTKDISGRYASEKKAILAMCEKMAGVSLSDIARTMDTSIPRVSRIVGEMVEAGLLVDLGKQESANGRRPSLYGLNPAAGLFVGVDVDEDNLSLAVTDFPGKVVYFRDNIPFRLHNDEESVTGLCSTVEDCLGKAHIDLAGVLSYGVNLTGRVNYGTGYSYSYFISEEKPIRDILEARFGKPVSVQNDSCGMAYGEYKGGMSSDAGTILFLNVSRGLGMGMVMDGKLFVGKSGFSGELGHVPILNNNRICRCGKIGCLETGASGIALHRLLIEKIQAGQPSLLSEAVKEGKDISLDNILDAVDKEDMTAIECIEEVGAVLGRAIAGLINIFNPDMVIVGGSLSAAERYLMPPLRSAVNKYSLNLVSSDTVIKVSRLGKKAGAIGASLLGKDILLNNY